MADGLLRRLCSGIGILAAALLLTPLAGHADPEPTAPLLEKARAAIRRGDGIDAEVKLKAALGRGVARPGLAAYFGEAYLLQGDLEQARAWLAPAVFTRATAAEGFHALAELEQRSGNLPAAGRAFDRVLAITPNDAALWVEIGRLRYRGGQHLLAIAAAGRAIAIAPRNVRALEFSGELVRDRYGLAAALPWFEAALVQAPKDVSVLSQYAATLGELDRASEMLVVTRRILEIAPGNPQAFYLQAVMAARAGQYELARGLLARTRGKLDALPGAVLLGGVLDLAAGNNRSAAETFERVLTGQPDNWRVKELLARALYLSGQYRYLTLRFRADLSRDDAPAYLVTCVARAHEALGERDKAGPLLDRAARPQVATLRIVPDRTRIGTLLAQGRSAEALALAEQARIADPGFYDNQSLAGDVQLALGHPLAAQQRYAQASLIRMPDSLILRRFEAYAAANDPAGASALVSGILAQSPGNRTALRLAAALALHEGDPLRAGAILDYLVRTGDERDVQLLSDLAVVRVNAGDARAGESAALEAVHLQRASPLAAQALGLSLATLGEQPGAAVSLLNKARRMLGDNAVLAEARERLQAGHRLRAEEGA